MRTKTVILLLTCLSLASTIWPATQSLTDKESFERAYAEGKALFYRTLRQKVSQAQLEEEDRKILIEAEKKIPGLYEHLINFYYYVAWEEWNKNNFHGSFLSVVAKMAEEFVASIPIRRWRKKSSPLQSVLNSTGFYARKFTPQFRRFLRPMTFRIKSQWALEELLVRKAHSYTGGEGIKLAIIDTGVDPTIREIKSQIVNWKNFLDGSKPVENKGRFPFDWGGHGTSIATIIQQVAPKAEMIIVKVFDQETMFKAPFIRWNVYLIAAGIIWAAQNGADIINLSAAFIVDTKSIREATKFCWENNVVVVSPLANMKENMTKEILFFPAAYPWTIAVGGVEKTNAKFKISPLSSKAEYLDVVAPSSGIFVETPSYLDRIKQSKMASRNSVAVPFVAGTSALILSAMDSSTLKKLKAKPGQLVETVRTILRQSSSKRKLGLDKQTSDSGSGMIDILKAVQMARNYSL